MMNWINGIAYMLSTICIISLLFKYKDKFYLSQYLIKYFKDNNKVRIIRNKKTSNMVITLKLVLLLILVLHMKLPQFIVIFPLLFPVPNKLILEIIKVLFNKIIEFIDILWIVLITLFGMNLFNWFQKFSLILPIIFIQFLFVIYILFFLKIGLLIFTKCKGSYLFYLISFVLSFIIVFNVIWYHATKENKNAIRVTKGKLKDLEGKSIKLFFKDGKKKFNIMSKNKEFYIENDSLFRNSIIEKILFNKENNVSLFMPSSFPLPIFEISNKIETKNGKIEKGEFVLINNENLKILDANEKTINDKISIEAKIIIIENNMADKNNMKNYIFLGNNLGWQLNQSEEIKIEEDKFSYNLLNLILFLFGIIYFWLKLYGKKSKEYYDYITLLEIKKGTKVLLDRNKYDKFLTLSAIGITIQNIWKIATTTNIGEMVKQIKFWTLALTLALESIPLIIFSIVLFCITTSKEISECVKELENKKPKRKRKNWQTNLCKKKGE
ncbi:hypothetical protein [Leptotrichia trevisanii]|uniref:hypothetical protein n=1 Tax=Leptotrichia trevisanii TaxID=109328 RepID=UPI00047E4B2B|nr:hypothetical protein [Leptotrichia trevisanii]